MTVTWTHGEAPHHAGGLPVASATSGQHQHHNIRANDIEQCSLNGPKLRRAQLSAAPAIEVGPRALQSVKRAGGLF